MSSWLNIIYCKHHFPPTEVQWNLCYKSPYMNVSIFGLCWTLCVSLNLYHSAYFCSFKVEASMSGSVIPPTLLVFIIVLTILGSLQLHIALDSLVRFYTHIHKCTADVVWDVGWACIESIDQIGGNRYLNTIYEHSISIYINLWLFSTF